MRIYIAGPMTGIAEYNFPAFDAKRDELRALGHIAVNPADMDRACVGFDPKDPVATIPVDRDFLRSAIVRSVGALLDCDAIALLPGWETSKGAQGELAVAKWFGLRVFLPNDTIPTALRVDA